MVGNVKDAGGLHFRYHHLSMAQEGDRWRRFRVCAIRALQSCLTDAIACLKNGDGQAVTGLSSRRLSSKLSPDRPPS